VGHAKKERGQEVQSPSRWSVHSKTGYLSGEFKETALDGFVIHLFIENTIAKYK